MFCGSDRSWSSVTSRAHTLHFCSFHSVQIVSNEIYFQTSILCHKKTCTLFAFIELASFERIIYIIVRCDRSCLPALENSLLALTEVQEITVNQATDCSHAKHFKLTVKTMDWIPYIGMSPLIQFGFWPEEWQRAVTNCSSSSSEIIMSAWWIGENEIFGEKEFMLNFHQEPWLWFRLKSFAGYLFIPCMFVLVFFLPARRCDFACSKSIYSNF